MQEEHNTTTDIEEPIKPLKFDENIRRIIAEIGKWGKFVGIVGFVFSGLLLVIGFVLIFMGDVISSKLVELGQPGGSVNSTVGLAYAVIAIIYYFPSRYLYDFAVYAKQAVEFDDQESITYSFERLKSLLRFLGMIAIIAIGFYAMMLLLAVFGAMFSSAL